MGILRLALGEGTTNMKLSFLLALLPWPWLMPRLKPIPTTDTVTLLDTDTPDTMVLAMPDTDTVLATTEATTARGPLMPSPLPPLRPRLIPTTDTTAMDTTVLDTAVPTASDTDTDTDTDTVLDTTDTEATTARGPLMPSPLPPLMPRLIPTTDTTAMDTAATDTATATDTTVKYLDDSSQPKTSLGTTSSEKWIAQFGSIPTSATSFSATRLAQARNGEQEAKENQNVMIRRRPRTPGAPRSASSRRTRPSL